MSIVGREEFHGGLAVLRGVAAAAVVVYHCMLVMRYYGADDAYLAGPRPDLALFHVVLAAFNGPACVTLFFVLSGTVLSLSLEREGNITAGVLCGYWVKRLFRLYPLLIFAALFAGLLQLYLIDGRVYEAATTWFNDDYKIAPSQLLLETVRNALGISSSLNSPSWSIKVEIIGSIIFPALFLLARQKATALPTLALVCLIMFLPVEPRWTAYMSVFAASFYVGALIPIYCRAIVAKLPDSAKLGCLTASVLIFLATRRLVEPTIFVPPHAIFLEMLTAAVIVSLVYAGPALKIYRLPPLRWLGEISYSLYLLHLPILFLIAHLLLAKGMLFSSWWLTVPTLILITFAITFAVAEITHLIIEKPFQRFGRWFGTSISLYVATKMTVSA